VEALGRRDWSGWCGVLLRVLSAVAALEDDGSADVAGGVVGMKRTGYPWHVASSYGGVVLIGWC
jgi:hypothetical protein